MKPALSNRVHLFAAKETRDAFASFATDVLGLSAVVSGDAPGLDEPVLAYRFSNGAWLSIEFTLEDSAKAPRNGAWLELVADDAPALRQRVLDVGLALVDYGGNDHHYFEAPGGQVFRIVSPEEM